MLYEAERELRGALADADQRIIAAERAAMTERRGEAERLRSAVEEYVFSNSESERIFST